MPQQRYFRHLLGPSLTHYKKRFLWPRGGAHHRWGHCRRVPLLGFKLKTVKALTIPTIIPSDGHLEFIEELCSPLNWPGCSGGRARDHVEVHRVLCDQLQSRLSAGAVYTNCTRYAAETPGGTRRTCTFWAETLLS